MGDIVDLVVGSSQGSGLRAQGSVQRLAFKL